jgi:tetratricopeptide (TPR) repeat protein
VARFERSMLSSGPALTQLRTAIIELHLSTGAKSHRDLAKLTHRKVSHTTVGAILRCERPPSWKMLEHVINALGGDTGTFRPLWIATQANAAAPAKVLDDTGRGESGTDAAPESESAPRAQGVLDDTIVVARYAEAVEQFERGDYAGARRRMELAMAAVRADEARILIELGLDEAASTILTEVLDVQTTIGLDLSAPDVARARRYFAELLARQGQIERAEQTVIELRQAQHAAGTVDSLDMADTGHTYALILSSRGPSQEAEDELGGVLDLRRRLLGTEHPKTRTARWDLAVLRWERGRVPDARRDLEDLLRDQLRISGAEHPRTLSTRHMLANIAAADGRLTFAERELRDVLRIRRRSLGAAHQDTLRALNSLAVVLVSLGYLEQAAHELRAACDQLAGTFGSEHPDTLGVRTNLANILTRQGQHEAAEREYRRIMDGLSATVGPVHRQSLGVRHNIGLALLRQGNTEAAAVELDAVLVAQRQVLGESHPDTLATWCNLADVLVATGRYREAEEEYAKIWQTQYEILGEVHPSTAATRHRLRNARRRQGREDDQP